MLNLQRSHIQFINKVLLLCKIYEHKKTPTTKTGLCLPSSVIKLQLWRYYLLFLSKTVQSLHLQNQTDYKTSDKITFEITTFL